MKKVLAMVLALGMTAGCLAGGVTAMAEETTEAATEAAAAGGDYVIGVLAPEVTHGWVAAVAYYAEMRCEELKADGAISDYIIATSGNAEDMTADLDDLLTQNVDETLGCARGS